MAHIQERENRDGSKSYRVHVRLKGCPAQYASFRRRTDAKRWAQQVETEIRQGRYFGKLEANKHTLAELIDRYLTDVARRWPKGEKKRAALLGFWKAEIGAYSLSEITPALIVEKRDLLARGRTYRGTKRSPATCNRYTAALSHAFSVAVREWGWVEENPFSRIQKLPEPRGRDLDSESGSALMKEELRKGSHRGFPVCHGCSEWPRRALA